MKPSPTRRRATDAALPRPCPHLRLPHPRPVPRGHRQRVVHSRSAVTTAVALSFPLVLVLGADPALADSGLAGSGQIVLAAASIDQVITNLRNWIMGLLVALATLFLTVDGVRYLMAGGDPGEVEKAKGALRSAAIGYGLAVLAPVIVEVLRGIVGG